MEGVSIFTKSLSPPVVAFSGLFWNSQGGGGAREATLHPSLPPMETFQCESRPPFYYFKPPDTWVAKLSPVIPARVTKPPVWSPRDGSSVTQLCKTPLGTNWETFFGDTSHETVQRTPWSRGKDINPGSAGCSETNHQLRRTKSRMAFIIQAV